jgi:hypothetical protein
MRRIVISVAAAMWGLAPVVTAGAAGQAGRAPRPVVAADQEVRTLPFMGPELAGFMLRVERTSSGVALICERGCAWKALTLGCDNRRPCAFKITDGGAIDDQTGTASAAFLFTVEGTTAGASLACQRGCAWKTLSIGCEGRVPCASKVSEYGTKK